MSSNPIPSNGHEPHDLISIKIWSLSILSKLKVFNKVMQNNCTLVQKWNSNIYILGDWNISLLLRITLNADKILFEVYPAADVIPKIWTTMWLSCGHFLSSHYIFKVEGFLMCVEYFLQCFYNWAWISTIDLWVGLFILLFAMVVVTSW